ncbi:hypothetical protein Scep_009589 [Stephania cephalantha]|uniref:Uncharacterized protein n=1 Tax=Stephania cephalantha TaxID=152367 RepID=A0AAP0JUW7_9MAGN
MASGLFVHLVLEVAAFFGKRDEVGEYKAAIADVEKRSGELLRMYLQWSAEKPSLLPLIATITTHNFSYGLSLAKGTAAKPPTLPRHREITENESRGESEDERVIDRESFARAFDVAALRVPAEDCFDLERRLRGHLPNRPRVRNVARVAGDEMEEELKRIVRGEGEEGEGDEKFDALNIRIHERERG